MPNDVCKTKMDASSLNAASILAPSEFQYESGRHSRTSGSGRIGGPSFRMSSGDSRGTDARLSAIWSDSSERSFSLHE